MDSFLEMASIVSSAEAEKWLVEEKFHEENFRVNREMREKICVIRPYFGRIFDENAVETQNRALPKFQILVPKSKSEFEI